MAVNMRVEATSGPRTVEVPDDVAADLLDAYNALKSLPVNRMVTTDPFTSEDYQGPAKINGETVTEEYKAAYNARLFVRQGKAWAATQAGPNGRPLVFARKGDIKGNPAVVSFRIYEVRETAEAEAGE